jgi:hypothetical protein
MAADTLIKWSATAKVLKYSPEQVNLSRNILGHEPDGIELGVHHAEPADGIATDEGNVLTTAGLARITSLIIGGGGQAAANGACGLGVGSSTTAATVADTNLGTPIYFQPADSTFPSSSSGVITIQATFASANGNGAWQEWGWVDCASFVGATTFAAVGTSPVLINHKITSLGTKASGASWVFVATVTLA